MLLDFLGTEEGTFDPSLLTADDIREWIVALSESGLKPSSINRMLSACSSFFKYLLREGIVAGNPFAKVSSLKTPALLPSFIPEGRMAALVGELVGRDGGGDGFPQYARRIGGTLFVRYGDKACGADCDRTGPISVRSSVNCM